MKQKETIADKRREKMVYYSLNLVIAFIFIFFIIGEFVIKNPSYINARVGAVSEEWNWKSADGQSGTLTLPASLDVENGVAVEIFTTLPLEIPDDTYFSIFTGNVMKIYVGDELRLEYKADAPAFYGKVVKSIYLSIRLYPSDAGKELRVVRDDPKYTNSAFNVSYMGNQAGILHEIISSEKITIVLSIFLAIFSLLVVVIAGIFNHFRDSEVTIIYLSLGIFIAATWNILDSRVCQFLFGNYYADGVAEYMLAMIIPYPFTLYLDREQKKRHHKKYLWMNFILLINFVILSVLHFTGIKSYGKTQIPMNIVVAGVIIWILCILCWEWKNHYAKEYILVQVGLIGLAVLGIVEIVGINAFAFKQDGIFLLIGLFFLLIMALIHSVRQIMLVEQRTIQAIQDAQMKTNFLASMSHEIRTPINAILGLNEMVIRESLEEKTQEYAGNIQLAGNNLLSIVNDILDFSKIESGKMEVETVPYDLSALLDNVISMIQVKADEKKLDLIISVDERMPADLFGDFAKIERILTNLLNNAVKYTRKGSVTLVVGGEMSKDVFPDSSKPLYVLKADIIDTGIGIKEEDKSKLFAEFQRVDQANNKGIEGTGLGLAITKNLVSLLNGSVNVESEYGVGSIFSVSIPQEVLSERVLGDYQEAAKQRMLTREKYHESFVAPDVKVLVVDDNSMNLMVVTNLLKQTRVQVATSDSGMDMLERVQNEYFDIILLDHMMPELDGVETLNRLREMEGCPCQNIPVIALTANALSGAREEYLSRGFSDYISKPVDGEVMEQVLLKFIPEQKRTIVKHSAAVTKPSSEIVAESDGVLINREVGMMYCGDSPEVYKELLGMFIQLYPEKREYIEKCYKEEDWKNYIVAVHSLKTNSLNIGAKGLSEEAKTLELAGKAGDFDKIREGQEKLLADYEIIVKEAEKML